MLNSPDTIIRMKRKQVNGITVSIWLLLVSSLVLYVFSGVVWWRNVYLDSDRVFWSAIEQALATNGVEKTVDYSSADTTQMQTIHLNFSPTISSTGKVTYKDANGRVANSESIGFAYSDYARYTTIENPELAKLKELEGVWTNTSAGEDTKSKVLADHLTNGALIFFGNFSKPRREQLVETMRNTKMYELIGVSGTKEYDGKIATIYMVRINTDAYNSVMATYFQMVGMPEFAEQISNDSEDSLVPIIEVAINPGNRQIYEAGYPKVGQSGSERYKLWGVVKQPIVPIGAITTEELQKRLEEAYTPTSN